jgi:glycosyltransferase involved in cell wall biosynthesis
MVGKNSFRKQKNFMAQKNRSTAIVMSSGISFEAWEKKGLASRELSYFRNLSSHIGDLCFLTYSDNLALEEKILHTFIKEAEVVPIGLGSVRRLPYGDWLAGALAPIAMRRHKNISLVRTNQFLGSWAAWALAKRYQIPFVVRCGYIASKNYGLEHPERHLRQKTLQKMESFIARSADHVIVTYPKAKEYFTEEYGVESEKISVLGNPIDTDLFSPGKIEAERDVIAVGRLEKEKNFELLIETCARVRASLTLIGQGSLKNQLEEKARALKLDIQFIDRVPNETLPSYFHRHKCFVLPSHYEGNPKSLLEAMACEMTVIASDIAEHREIIDETVSGFLTGLDVLALEKKLVLALSPGTERRAIGANARKKIVNEFSMAEIARRESEIHRQFH